MKAESEIEFSAFQARVLAMLLLRGADCFDALDPEIERALHASLGDLLCELVAIRRTGGKVRLTELDTIAVLVLLQVFEAQPESDPPPTLQ